MAGQHGGSEDLQWKVAMRTEGRRGRRVPERQRKKASKINVPVTDKTIKILN